MLELENLPRLNHRKSERPVTSKEIKLVTRNKTKQKTNPSSKDNQWPAGVTGEVY